MTNKDCQVIILGAGPAGLSLGQCLAERGILYTIIEKENFVGSTFVKMTDSTTYGPWLNNVLPGGELPWYRLLTRATRPEYAKYLQNYARKHELRILTGTAVTSVTQGHGFLVETADGQSFRSDLLVNATGYFSKPYVPIYPGMNESSIPVLHSSAYRCPETVRGAAGRQRAKVLVVGAGLSAGEIIAELFDSNQEVHLSHRGPIETMPSQLEETLLSPFVYLWEELARRVGLPRPFNLRPSLRRGRQYRLLSSGQVPTHPAISRFDGQEVRFIDKTVERFDVVLFATGYQPALDHLSGLLSCPPEVRNLESLEAPGCFFLGLVGGRSFRSEFLRGIREDAVYLATVLENRLQANALKVTTTSREAVPV
jgi:putative flavoprotein involved in K+ transport